MDPDLAVLLLTPAAAGLIAGYATGGSLAGLLGTRLRALWLLWLAAAVQLAELSARGMSRDLRLPLLALTFALAGAWLAINLPGQLRGVQWAALGAMAGGVFNGVAIAANGRMPYSPAAARLAHIPVGSSTAKNVAAGEGSHLTALGDIIPVPVLHAIISAGDILIVTGAVTLIAAAMHAAPRRPVSHQHSPLEETA